MQLLELFAPLFDGGILSVRHPVLGGVRGLCKCVPVVRGDFCSDIAIFLGVETASDVVYERIETVLDLCDLPELPVFFLGLLSLLNESLYFFL